MFCSVIILLSCSVSILAADSCIWLHTSKLFPSRWLTHLLY